jgi:hypothetical protein
VLLGAGLLLPLWRAAGDPWAVNRRLWRVVPYEAGADEVFAWLREHDPGAYAIHNHDHFFPSFATIGHVKHEMQVLNSVWLFTPRPRPDAGAPDGGLLVAAPKYVVAAPGSPPPPGATPLREFPAGTVYAAPPGLPFAFVAAPGDLPYGAGAAAPARRPRPRAG